MIQILLPMALVLSTLATPRAMGDTLEKHKLNFSARLRYAHLHQQHQLGRAASALLRFTADSQWSPEVQTTLELDHVSTWLQSQHSDNVRFNGKPAIPDVPGTEINQAFMQWKPSVSRITLGRQRIELDRQRFVGSSSIWQNEQTFDSLGVHHPIFGSSRISYHYITKVHRIFGDKADNTLSKGDTLYGPFGGQRPAPLLGDHRHNTHLGRVEINEWDYGTFVAYAYAINNQDQPEANNDTLGLSYRFHYKPGAIKYRAHLELAKQERPEFVNSLRIPYYLAEFGAAYKTTEVSARYEILGAKGGSPFITPLGSNHEYQGWADQFISTPAQGLVDQSVKLSSRIRPWRLDLVFHQFKQHKGHRTYGSEINMDLIYRMNRKHKLFLRFAQFNASNWFKQEGRSNLRNIFLSYSYNL